MARTEGILTDEEVLLAQALADLAVSSSSQAIRKSGASTLANVNIVSGTFTYSEVPTGTINGTTGSDGNADFTLAATPTAGTLRLYKNGIRQKLTDDYTLSGTTITFVSGAIPVVGDKLLADYNT